METIGAASDAELLAASAEDATAFRAIYDRHCRAVRTFFARRAHNPSDVLDLVAETFAAAWLSRDRFLDQRQGDAGPWLYGIARNVLRRSARTAGVENRARQRLGLLRDATEPAGRGDPANGVVGGEVDTTLQRLPPSQREAVRLRVIAGADYDELATRLDCSPAAARVRVSRGLDTIRRQMEEEANG